MAALDLWQMRQALYATKPSAIEYRMKIKIFALFLFLLSGSALAEEDVERILNDFSKMMESSLENRDMMQYVSLFHSSFVEHTDDGREIKITDSIEMLNKLFSLPSKIEADIGISNIRMTDENDQFYADLDITYNLTLNGKLVSFGSTNNALFYILYNKAFYKENWVKTTFKN